MNIEPDSKPGKSVTLTFQTANKKPINLEMVVIFNPHNQPTSIRIKEGKKEIINLAFLRAYRTIGTPSGVDIVPYNYIQFSMIFPNSGEELKDDRITINFAPETDMGQQILQLFETVSQALEEENNVRLEEAVKAVLYTCANFYANRGALQLPDTPIIASPTTS